MNSLLICLLAALVAAAAPAARNKPTGKSKGTAVQAADPNEALEQEYLALLEKDDTAQEEVEKMARENAEFQAQGAGLAEITVRGKIQERLRPVRKAYEDFLRRNPKHIRARLAFGSFLNDTGEELEANEQWEKARKLDPTNPAAWNNLANYYGHRGPIIKAFEYYAKAIELNPNEPVYYHNLGTSVFLFRTDATNFYKINEQQVFDKALDLYGKALKLAPNDFTLASDVAQTYYGIKPARTEDALAAWEFTLSIAGDDIQREGVFLHMARVNMIAGRFDAAREHLGKVRHESYQALKDRIGRSIVEREAKAKSNDPASNPPAID